jgi:hypothetical protein
VNHLYHFNKIDTISLQSHEIRHTRLRRISRKGEIDCSRISSARGQLPRLNWSARASRGSSTLRLTQRYARRALNLSLACYYRRRVESLISSQTRVSQACTTVAAYDGMH